MNASDKLLLIHSSGLFTKIEDIQDVNFKDSLEYILLKVSTYIYKDKNIDKAITYLKNIIVVKLSSGDKKKYLIPVNKIKSGDVNYYIELLMLICNCNFYKEGIGKANIEISEHILKFKLKTEQEIQFIVSLIKSYITTGENKKSKKYIDRLKDIFREMSLKEKKINSEEEENSIVESAFSLLIFFDYGDYRSGNMVVEFILNNFDLKNFDLSNYSQMCFALFASYNFTEYENFYSLLEKRNNEKNRTIFSTYKNQFEFQTILRKFLNFEFTKVISELEVLKKNTFQKNYIYFIDSLILYCYNLLGDGEKVLNILESNIYNISSTRKLILGLEASLLTGDKKLYVKFLKEINSLKKINFTLFNQAVICFCESYAFAQNREAAKFKKAYLEFLRLCEEYEFDNYIHFRANAGKLKKVFSYAAENDITNKYIERIIPLSKLKKVSNSQSLNINVEFLNGNKIFINHLELTDDLWHRPKSKSIFLYIVYKSVMNHDITKDKLIDDILYNSKDIKYDAIADVEINKVRKTLQTFISDLFKENVKKEILVIKGKKYQLTSGKIEVEIETDFEKFKKLCSSNKYSDKYSAIDLYKTDFGESLYQNWAEDIRENLRFIYSETVHKLIAYYENLKDTTVVKKLLERLVESEFSDDDNMIKLLSIYNDGKDFRKIKFMYNLYEKRLKKEFNIQPSDELKKFYQEVIPGSLN
jgi:two-component SAPR family response regulator